MNLAQDFRDCAKKSSWSSSRRDAVNIAEDFSPGTASGLNDLVPEARLSRGFSPGTASGLNDLVPEARLSLGFSPGMALLAAA